MTRQYERGRARARKRPLAGSSPGRRRAMAVIIVTAVVVAAAVAADFIARQRIEDGIAAAMRPSLGRAVSVSIGAAPALADLVGGSIGTV